MYILLFSLNGTRIRFRSDRMDVRLGFFLFVSSALSCFTNVAYPAD